MFLIYRDAEIKLLPPEFLLQNFMKSSGFNGSGVI